MLRPRALRLTEGSLAGTPPPPPHLRRQGSRAEGGWCCTCARAGSSSPPASSALLLKKNIWTEKSRPSTVMDCWTPVHRLHFSSVLAARTLLFRSWKRVVCLFATEPEKLDEVKSAEYDSRRRGVSFNHFTAWESSVDRRIAHRPKESDEIHLQNAKEFK